MRKLLTSIFALAVSGSVFAGGLVTNNNHSALFTRMQSRNASTDIDAVYFNPAGLTKLADGFHVSLSNQTVGQTKTVNTSYPYFNSTPKDFEGKVSAPIFPAVYAAYKTGKLAFSFGFNPIGGGGGATYDAGLPSFEMQIADLVPYVSYICSGVDQTVLTNTGTDPHFRNISGYEADIFFEGSSIYFGFQLNASYEINDMLSVALGGRLVTASNSYIGSIDSVKIGTPAPYGGMQSPGDYFRVIGAATSQTAYFGAVAAQFDDATTIEADASMKGMGFTPIISVNFTPNDMINVSLRYEFKTKLELTTTVNEGESGDPADAEGMFIQDSVVIADLPACLSFGVGVRPFEPLLLTGSFNYYFDQAVDYDGQADVEVDKIDKNFLEFALGARYNLTEKFDISAGWQGTITGVNDDYQSDLTYSTNTNTFGAGLGYKINDMIALNLGGAYTLYAEGAKSYNHTSKLGLVPAADIYNKTTWVVALGVDFHF